MFKFLFKDKVINTIVDKITKEVNTSLVSINNEQNSKFDQVIEHLEKLRFELSSLDQRLTQKELRDKVEYGQMHYKISSLQDELIKKKRVQKVQINESH